MKKMTVLFLGLILSLSVCKAEPKPWVGTYALEITEETRETHDMFVEMGMKWPEITLNQDGTFVILKTEDNATITGTYTVDGNILTLTAEAVNGESPEGEYAEPHTAEFRDDYQVLLMEGSDSEPFVREEKNEAFLKKQGGE